MQTLTRLFRNTLTIAALILTVSAIDAAAATFTVSNTNDSGAGSLRQAVLDSNSTAGSDTIVFDSGVFSTPQTITLASVITINPATGDSLTITGPAANLLTISGNNVTGIFVVSTGDTASISGMTLTAGKVDFDGAGISNTGNLTVTNMVFSQNTSGYGGAIANVGTLTVTGCAFTNNSASSGQPGGAIYSNTTGTVTITNSTFTGNTHTATNGGAIGNRGGTMTITDSIFTNNSTFTNGGAIHNGSATLNISGSTFTGNTATRVDAGNGGAISNQNGGQLTIANSLITGNSASVFGGGIYYQPNATTGAFLTITNSIVSNNIANSDSNSTGDGGGLYLTGEGSVSISGSTINGNQSKGGGGTTTSGDGGGIDVSTPLTLTNSTISGNTAGRNGGGIYASGTSTIIVTVESSTIVNNTATINGGGVQRASTTNPVNFHNTIVANNTANGGTSQDVLGTVNSNGYNLIENTTGATFNGDTSTNITDLDPNLGALQNNGGPTFTHALLTGSPAIDKGQSSGLTTDQRGETRPVDDPSITNATDGDGADIGAFEVQPTLQFSAATYGVNENVGTATVTVTRAGGSQGTDTVQFATANGTATGGASCTAGVDYVPTSGTLTFAATDTSRTFNITICNDNVFENANETINLSLSNAAGATFGTPTTSVLTIVDDEPQPAIAISDAFVSEPSTGTSPSNFNITLSNPSVQTVTVHYSTANGTATSPGDYQSTTGTVTFNPLETSKTVTVQVNFDGQPEPNETFFVNLDSPTNATIVDAQGQATITDFVSNTAMLINEFRFRGTAGIGDEFVELLNNTDSDITVATSDGSAGWSIVTADNLVRVIIANGTLIRAHGHYLAGCGCTYFSPDINFAGGDIPSNSGIALYKSAQSFTPANKFDAVGFSGTVAGFFEGTPLTPGADVDAEYSFVRKIPASGSGNGKSLDTDNNAGDFILVSTTGNVGGVNTALGAPSPEGVNAPRLNGAIAPSLIDPMTAGTGAPNRARLSCRNTGDPDNGAPLCSAVDPNTSSNGYLSIRRKFTNNTGGNVTRLRFNIIDITTLNNTQGVSAPVADLRAITSTDVTVTTGTGSVLVRGTTLNQPPTQPNGGGLNSSLTAGSVTTTPMAPGDVINVQFLLGVRNIGNFRFFVNVEALP